MVKRRRILNADKIIQNVIQVFCLLMFLQFKRKYLLFTFAYKHYKTITTWHIGSINKDNVIY